MYAGVHRVNTAVVAPPNLEVTFVNVATCTRDSDARQVCRYIAMILTHINTDNIIHLEIDNRHNSYCIDTFGNSQVCTHMQLFMLMFRLNVSLLIYIINYYGCRDYLTSLFAR